MITKNVSLLVLFTFFSFFAQEKITISTIYGDCQIHEPVIIELLACSTMQRLKHIHQYGIDYYVIKPDNYSRYEHSIGVFYLLRRFGASLEEQIAGLLHDASHTVFSHVGDWFYDKTETAQDSYQDRNHETLLSNSDAYKILHKYGISLEAINHKNKRFTCLEQSLPDICADRLEYNLFGGLLEHLITIEDVHQILADITFKDNTWYFSNPGIARQFAEISLLLTKYVWASPYGLFVDQCTALILKRLVALHCITCEDINHSTDDNIWDIMLQSSDSQVLYYRALMQRNQKIRLVDEYNFDMHLKGKFRGIDPLIKTSTGLQRLTVLDTDFKKLFNQTKAQIQRGWHITLH